ncbi:MAG TPA: flagellar basal-body MS-ring/collar protein FliF [Steroidobacteraceae bacterium]|jgi:flagellar M-ring protein FliF|nr:flagellar basal-body MS-ring/collar protein FliF [Steroidobacteraceae bacterium]
MAGELINPAGPRLISGLKPLMLLVGVAAAIAVGVGVMLWAIGPTYSLLYSNLGAEETGQIAQALDAARIPYKLDASGNSLSVPAEQLASARLKLAAQGLPESGGGVNAMTKDPGFGVSQFMENARYQHALETELARTIASVQNVQGARVHLAMARQSAFVSDRRPGSASVFLQLKAGRRLDEEQVQAIANLVASSIPELSAAQVTVVDQAGRLLSSPDNASEEGRRDRMFEVAHRLEESYANRIQELLTPLVGIGRVRAQVVAQVDMATTESTREQFNPQSQVVRSESTSEEAAKNGAAAAGGVPGALTNQPPQPGVALPPGVQPTVAQGAANPAAAAGATPNNAGGTEVTGPDSKSRQSTRNYEIDRTMAYTRTPAGRVTRLSVAVLVDNLRTTAADGKVTESPLPPEQIERLTALVKDAVGFDATRGDTVNIVNSSFAGVAAIPEGELETQPFWEKAWVQDLAKLLGGVIVLFVIVFSVLKPLTKGLLSQARQQPQLVSVGGGNLIAGGGGGGESQSLAYEQQVAQARGLVSQDPKRVAQVVKTWVSTDG